MSGFAAKVLPGIVAVLADKLARPIADAIGKLLIDRRVKKQIALIAKRDKLTEQLNKAVEEGKFAKVKELQRKLADIRSKL